MTTTAPERPADAPPATALQNRRIKARAIALHLWRHGLTVDDIRALPYTSRDRSVATMAAFAREAFAASPRPEAQGKDAPDGWASQTWVIAADKLAEIEAMRGRGEQVPERDRVDQRARWLPALADDEPRAATQDEAEAEADTLTMATPAPVPLARAADEATGVGAGARSMFDAIDVILGPACPDCGWRRGFHRPGIAGLTACARESA